MAKVNYGIQGNQYITPAMRAQAGIPFTGAQYRYEVLAGGITPIPPSPPPTNVAPSWSVYTPEIPWYGGVGDWNGVTTVLEGDTISIDCSGQQVLLNPQPYTQFNIGPEGYSGPESYWMAQRLYTGQNGREFGLCCLLLWLTHVDSPDSLFQVGQSWSGTVPAMLPGEMNSIEVLLAINANPGTMNIAGAFHPKVVVDRGTRNLTWSAPSSPGGTITGYQIQYSSDGGANWSDGGVFNSTTADLSTLNLAPNTAYKIGVATITSNAGCGDFATIDTITPPMSNAITTENNEPLMTETSDNLIWY